MGWERLGRKQHSALTEKWNVLGEQEKIPKKEMLWKGRMERLI